MQLPCWVNWLPLIELVHTFLHLISPCFFLQSLRLFQLLAELEGKATALKQEALQHLFIALAGSDCCELWTLLVTFFGKGADTDPFEFLDTVPAMKQPLDLVDTDSEEEASVADSTTSAAASNVPERGSTTSATPPPAPAGVHKDFKLAPKPSWPDLVASIEQAEGFIVRSFMLPQGITLV